MLRVSPLFLFYSLSVIKGTRTRKTQNVKLHMTGKKNEEGRLLPKVLHNFVLILDRLKKKRTRSLTFFAVAAAAFTPLLLLLLRFSLFFSLRSMASIFLPKGPNRRAHI